jgi:hypothetical protein
VAHRVRWIEQDEGRIGGLTEVGLHECVKEWRCSPGECLRSAAYHDAADSF